MLMNDDFDFTEAAIYDQHENKIGTLQGIQKVNISVDSEERYNLETDSFTQTFKSQSMEIITDENNLNSDIVWKLFGYDTGRAPDMYSVVFVKHVQNRRHRKKRINKKWLQRYGYKEIRAVSAGWQVRRNTDGTIDFVK